MPPAVMAGVGIAGNIAGGVIAGKGAKDAAKIQARAAKEAAALRAKYGHAAIDHENEATRDAIAREAAASQGAIQSYDAYTQQAIADRGKATEDAIKGRFDETNKAIQARDAYANVAAQQFDQGTQQAIQARDRYSNEASNIYEKGAREAAGKMDPWYGAGEFAVGELQEGLQKGGDLARAFTSEDFETDPGYQFRLSEGMKALERSAAAKGRTLGGRAAKELTRFNQGFASHEYGVAEGRFQRNQANRYDRLMGLSSQGQGAGMYQGDLINKAGAYRAEGAREGGRFAGDAYARAAAFRGGLTAEGSRFAGNAYERAAADNQDARLGQGHFQGAAELGQADFAGRTLVDSGRYGAGATERSGRYTGDTLNIIGGGVADYSTQGANAEAAGRVGSANAWNDAIGGAVNVGMDAYNLHKSGQKKDVYRV